MVIQLIGVLHMKILQDMVQEIVFLLLYLQSINNNNSPSTFTCAYNGVNQQIGKLVTPVPSNGTIDVTIGGGIMVLNKQFKTLIITSVSNNIFYILYEDGTSTKLSIGTFDASRIVAIYASGGNINVRYSFSYSLS